MDATTLISAILSLKEGQPVSARFQDPKIETRRDVTRPFYFVRFYVPVFDEKTGKVVRKRHPEALGFCDEMSIAKAKAKKARIMELVNSGRFVLEAQLPFAAVVRRFRDCHLPTLGRGTQKKYDAHLRNHIEPAFGECRMCDITTPSIEAWIRSLEHERTIPAEGDEPERKIAPLAWWTRKDLLCILSCIFSEAIRWRMWDGRNPVEGISAGRKRILREKRILTREELARFVDAITETRVAKRATAQRIVLLGAVTGLRISEILGLRVEDLDASRATLEINKRWSGGDEDEPKSAASNRVVYVGAFVREILAECGDKKPHDRIFVSPKGEPLDDRDLQQHVFRPAATRAGCYFAGFGAHTLRRLNITWRQTVAGASPIEAQKIAGHSSIDMTLLYTQAQDDRLREQADKLLKHVGWSDLKVMRTEGGVQ